MLMSLTSVSRCLTDEDADSDMQDYELGRVCAYDD